MRFNRIYTLCSILIVIFFSCTRTPQVDETSEVINLEGKTTGFENSSEFSKLSAGIKAGFEIDTCVVDFITIKNTRQKIGIIQILDDIEDSEDYVNGIDNIAFGVASIFFDCFENQLVDSDNIIVKFQNDVERFYSPKNLNDFNRLEQSVIDVIYSLENGVFPTSFDDMLETPSLSKEDKSVFIDHISKFHSMNNFDNWRVENCILVEIPMEQLNEDAYSIKVNLFSNDYQIGNLNLTCTIDDNDHINVLGFDFKNLRNNDK